jgi:hypothetical protein
VTVLPQSIRQINALPDDDKLAIYSRLVPAWVMEEYHITTLHDPHIMTLVCPNGSRAVELSLRRDPTEVDPLLYINMADTFNGQILVLLVVVNDPDSPRFNIDVDLLGNRTHFGTTSRNLPAEKAAMAAGLAPGQVRRGLRAFKRSVPVFEQFISDMGHDLFLIEPLAYHNAIVFERYGFNYLRGLKDMQEIHAEFQPGGYLHAKMNDSTPFRPSDGWNRIRSRSWAIHDGILEHPFTGFQMYKRIGIHAGINTAPDTLW